MRNVVIIGGGAAGCFCAAEISSLHPDWQVTVLEAGPRLMAKLAVTGGGRCNITNTFEGVESLSGVYPRGERLMKRLLHSFGPQDVLRWFGREGVEFTAQPDHCIFPVSQDAMQIVRTLERRLRAGGVKVLCNSKVESIGADLSVKLDGGYYVNDSAEANGISAGSTVISTEAKRSGEIHLCPDAVVVTTGGGTASRLLTSTGISLVPDVPSLFTLKIADDGLRSLMGTVVENVTLGLAGTRFRSQGALLLTDWGVSGPATLRLSSYAARHLAESGYRGSLLVNWLNLTEASVRERLAAMGGSGRTIANSHPAELTDRLWHMLVQRAGIRPDCRWNELGSKGLARLVNILMSDCYEISGRARFKEEFVTCGGVALSEIRPDTLESRKIPDLYFAGEVLDIDAVTGGFNLQAAWSTAYTVAHSIADN